MWLDCLPWYCGGGHVFDNEFDAMSGFRMRDKRIVKSGCAVPVLRHIQCGHSAGIIRYAQFITGGIRPIYFK